MIQKLTQRWRDFAKTETASGQILLWVTVVTLIWANSPLAEFYKSIVHLPLNVPGFGHGEPLTLHEWVNDGLMVLFFFVVGMEIKRELVKGELSNTKRAMLPVIAALGGMLVPALIFLGFNQGTPWAKGWAIPTATDIAFAVGILTLGGKRVPVGLRIFLLALAIIDDLGAIVIIALFYSNKLSLPFLTLAAMIFVLIWAIGRSGVKSYAVYCVFGLLAWYFTWNSGIHATIAGVVLGFLTPVDRSGSTHLRGTVDHLVHHLHPWVAFAIMPCFAFFNAGVSLSGIHFSTFLGSTVTLGIFFGLFLGKPIGVVVASWFAVKTKLGALPNGVNWSHMAAAGALAGIGFTMALFVSHLSLAGTEFEDFAKLSILLGSTVSAILGLALLKSKPLVDQ